MSNNESILNQRQKQELHAKLQSFVQNVKLNGNVIDFGGGQLFRLPTQASQPRQEISSTKTTSR